MASLFHLVPGHSDSTYHDTEGKDSEHGDTPLNRLSMTKNMRSSRRMGCYILTGVVLFLGIFATITMLNVKSIVTTLHSWEESTRALEKPTEDPLKQVWQCGKSKAEAEELKCRFNAVMWAWEPALCFDEELHAAEIAAHEWFYYRTKWMNKVPSEGDRVPIAEVIDGQHERLYSTVNPHKWHCLYSWKQLQKALQNGKPIMSYALSWPAVSHCANVLMGSKSPTEIGTQFRMSYGTCSMLR